jgi:hypothetical protein
MGRQNVIASMRMPAVYGRLRDIDAIFGDLVELLNNTPDQIPAWFAMRAHSAFLGGCSLAMSGQVTEAYMCFRGCLEAAFYGLLFFKHPELRETWINRHKSEVDRKKTRDLLKVGDMLREVEWADEETHRRARDLYERAIDFGAHPNPRAIFSVLRRTPIEGGSLYEMQYLTAEPIVLGAAFRACAQTGACALRILRIVFRERFDITGLTERLRSVESDLW